MIELASSNIKIGQDQTAVGSGQMLELNQSCMDVGAMYKLGQVQFDDWARRHIDIGPGPMLGFTFPVLM